MRKSKRADEEAKQEGFGSLMSDAPADEFELTEAECDELNGIIGAAVTMEDMAELNAKRRKGWWKKIAEKHGIDLAGGEYWTANAYKHKIFRTGP